MAESSGDKSEKPTQARRDEFRKQGQIAQTKELATAFFLLAASGGIYAVGRFFFANIYDLFQHAFGPDLIYHIRQGDFTEVARYSAVKSIMIIAPVMAIGAIISFASSALQIGFLKVEDALTPDLNKLNPIEGFKRIFSMRALVEGLKSLLKMIGIGFVMYLILKGEVAKVPYLQTYTVFQIFEYIGEIVGRLLSTVGMVIFGLAAADYFFQRWDLEKKMMMTKQEVKEEHKSREGDPMIKARIRRIQRDLASRRMMDAVPKGDVVITNPTHIAVVLKYGKDVPAPQLIAMGADHVAEKIKEIARQNNIPIVENKPLARTIFKTMKIGQIIPRELFVAVAEVLSYVFKLRKKVKK